MTGAVVDTSVLVDALRGLEPAVRVLEDLRRSAVLHSSVVVRAEVPYVYFAATKGASPVESVAAFLADLRDSSLPTDRELVATNGAGSWPDAFRVLAAVLPATPCIVVLDKLPWLAEQDDLFDGAADGLGPAAEQAPDTTAAARQ